MVQAASPLACWRATSPRSALVPIAEARSLTPIGIPRSRRAATRPPRRRPAVGHEHDLRPRQLGIEGASVRDPVEYRTAGLVGYRCLPSGHSHDVPDRVLRLLDRLDLVRRTELFVEIPVEEG